MLRVLLVACTLAGIVITLCGLAAVLWFCAAPPKPGRTLPKLSVLRPLCGLEPGLEAALASLCAQDYPCFELVLGVQDPADPALAAVAAVRARFPHVPVLLAIDPASHGPNRKIGNLINMLPLSSYDTLVFSDSDLHVPPDYLRRIAAALERPGTGLVTALCTGRPSVPGLSAALGAVGITHGFLPGALLARALGRQDGLGTTMALRRDVLARIGGLGALAPHLADDNLLGQRVRALGLRIALAACVPATSVPETTLASLWRHELRWARTIRGLAPAGFAASALQFPLFWAALALACSGAWRLGLAAWAIRALAAALAGRVLGASPGPWRTAALLPLRDLLSVAEITASFAGGRVHWRGHEMQVGPSRWRWTHAAAQAVAELEEERL